jgi:predicted proteasome-type protease
VRPPNVLLRDMTANPVPLDNDNRTAALSLLITLMENLRVSLPILPYFLPHACFQENCLAQLATVDQRHELLRGVRGSNQWLEHDAL